MTSFYNKVTNLSLPEAVGIAIISIPSYIIYKDCVKPTLKNTFSNTLHVPHKTSPIQSEEDILESKIRSENLRPGPAFLDSHAYHSRRVERVKSAYSSIWNLVNQNLDLGNQTFKVALAENDRKVLNVCKRLLIDELLTDGYVATVQIKSLFTDSALATSDTENSGDHYFEVNIE